MLSFRHGGHAHTRRQIGKCANELADGNRAARLASVGLSMCNVSIAFAAESVRRADVDRGVIDRVRLYDVDRVRTAEIFPEATADKYIKSGG